jgi:hypothetical protein
MDETADMSGAAAAHVSRPDVLDAEDASKDAFFVQTAALAEAMIARHGKDFAMGTLVLAARFIAEGRPLIKHRDSAAG